MTELLSKSDELIVLDPQARALLFTEARSANSFTNEPVTEAQLRAIYELTKFPPTAANTQPLRILYVGKGQSRERLVTHLSGSNKGKTLTAPAVAVLAADLEFHQQMPRLFPIRPQLKDSLDADPESRERMARFNAALQTGYFLLGIRAAGLAAGPMAGLDADGVDREFFPDGRWKSILVVNIGHPGESAWFDRLPRLGYDEVVRHI